MYLMKLLYKVLNGTKAGLRLFISNCVFHPRVSAAAILPIIFIILTVGLFSSSSVSALTFTQPVTDTDTVVLQNGDVLHGKILKLDTDQVTIEHPVLGEIVIARSNTTKILLSMDLPHDAEVEGTDDSKVVVETSDSEISQQESDESTIENDEPEYPWESHIDLGISGSNGRSEKFDSRIMLTSKQTRDDRRTMFDMRYRNASSQGDRNLNIFETGLGMEWPIKDTRWFGFARGRFDYDEFARYGYRFSGGGGLGYDFIRNEKTTLVGRAGLGLVREFNSPDEDIVPEAILALDWTHKLSERQSINAGAEIIPELREIGDYRAILKAEWVVDVDFMKGANFKVGVRDDIEKRKNNQQDDLLDFYAMLGFDF